MAAVVAEQGQAVAQGRRAYQEVEVAYDVSGGPQAPSFPGEYPANVVVYRGMIYDPFSDYGTVFSV